MKHNSTFKAKGSILFLEVPPSLTKIPPDQLDTKEKEVTHQSEPEKIPLKLNSPYVLEACKKLGLSIHDLKRKYLSNMQFCLDFNKIS